jgi:3-oxoadipate CoA-transferase beta subunit
MNRILNRYSRDQIAARVAQDIFEGAYVNLGIGLPTKVANFLPADREVFLHSDICVLGAFQVSEKGDLANWHTGAPDAIPAVGGAMDLALGAKKVYVMMDHQTKTGESKIVRECSYPLTGVACVNRVYTDLAVLDVTPDGLRVVEMAPGLTFEELQTATSAPLLAP